jgi:hypothetical protein
VSAIEVRDTGVGIPAERQAAVFAPFEQAEGSTTRRFGGTGLGLAISRSLCDLMGYGLTLESRPGVGTTFRVEVAAAPRPAAGTAGSADVVEAGAAPLVLVVDDEPQVARVAQRVLERAGYRVLLAVGGLEGVRVMRERGAELDAVLSDILMPELNGLDLAARAAAHAPRAPVVLMSAYTDPDVSARELGGLAAGFVQKPFTGDVLLAALAGAGVRRPSPAAG